MFAIGPPDSSDPRVRLGHHPCISLERHEREMRISIFTISAESPEYDRAHFFRYAINEICPLPRSAQLFDDYVPDALAVRFGDDFSDRKSTRLNSSHLV